MVWGQLNNRELAALFWLSILVALVFIYGPTRRHLPGLLKTLLHRKIFAALIFMAGYIGVLLVGFERLGVWQASSHLVDTFAWLVTVALVMFINVTDVPSEEHFFRKVAGDSLKVTVVLEFIVGLHPFSLRVEIALMPFLVLLGAMTVYTETGERNQSLHTIIQWLIGIVGLVFVSHSVRELLADVSSFFALEQFIDFALPFVLTFLFIPYIYLLALFLSYENVFRRLGSQNQGSQLIGYAKRRLFLRFGFNLRRLVNWSGQHPNLRFSNKEALHKLMKTEVNRRKTTDRTIEDYRKAAEPIMEEIKSVIDEIDLADSQNRLSIKNQLGVYRMVANRLQYKDEFPLKHETLEYTIKHTLDAVAYADRGDTVSAEQAMNRALLNQQRFDDWTLDVG